MRVYYVYILASITRTLYVGITNDLQRRVRQHKERLNDSFTARYNVDRLVYYEDFNYVYNAIAREKALKRWRREKKIFLIESINPEWNDLSLDC